MMWLIDHPWFTVPAIIVGQFALAIFVGKFIKKGQS